MQKILIVEDELAYSKLLSSQLESRGYKIVTAKDGEEGLAKAKKEQPDLTLLDIRMPKMDGMALLEQLRRQMGPKHRKIIILTNLEPDQRILQKVVTQLPSYYFIKSNIGLEDLMSKIESLLAEPDMP